jgi:DNA-binding NarL/FixJ family response regulator
MSPPRILVAGAHPIAAVGLTNIAQQLGYELVGAVTSGHEALTAANEYHPDVMLMDVDNLRGEMDGITAAVEIHNRFGIRSIFLAEHFDGMMQARAAKADPLAVLDKTSSVSVIADALQGAVSSM